MNAQDPVARPTPPVTPTGKISKQIRECMLLREQITRLAMLPPTDDTARQILVLKERYDAIWPLVITKVEGWEAAYDFEVSFNATWRDVAGAMAAALEQYGETLVHTVDPIIDAIIARNKKLGIKDQDIRKAWDIFSAELHEGQICRVCGCTDFNCSQCIDATGKRCHWVEPDLCSRCASVEDVSRRGTETAEKGEK